MEIASGILRESGKGVKSRVGNSVCCSFRFYVENVRKLLLLLYLLVILTEGGHFSPSLQGEFYSVTPTASFKVLCPVLKKHITVFYPILYGQLLKSHLKLEFFLE